MNLSMSQNIILYLRSLISRTNNFKLERFNYMQNKRYIVKGNIAIDNKWENLEMLIEGSRIIEIDKSVSINTQIQKIYLNNNEGIIPGLINGHEHLISNWYPGVFRDAPYETAFEWLECLKDTKYDEKLVERHEQLSFDLALLGSYKQIISGVSTIINHAPINGKDTISRWQNLPINIMPNVYNSWGIYEVENNDMIWNRGILDENKEAHKRNGLHIIHACEGKKSNNELARLSRMIPFDNNLLLIHLNTIDEKDIQLLSDLNVNICLCPTSNYNLFQTLPNVSGFISHNANLMLGTDSWLSGSISLIDEIQNFRKWFPSIKDNIIYKMVTCNPMKAFYHVDNYENFTVGNVADLLVVSNIDHEPSKTLMNLNYCDIELLVVKGESVYSSDYYYDMAVPHKSGEWSQIKIGEKTKRIWGNPHRVINRCCSRANITTERFGFLPIKV